MKKTIRHKRIRQKGRLKNPNLSSNTAASLVIDAHYAKLRIRERWTAERIERLCAFLRISVGELGSLLGVQHGWWREHIKSTKPLGGPVCILLTIIEARFMKDFTKDVITNIFSFDGKQENT
jgi:hypothetical protein